MNGSEADWQSINYPALGTGEDRARWWADRGALVFPVEVRQDDQGKEVKLPKIRGWQKAETYRDGCFGGTMRPFDGFECGVLLGPASGLLLADLDGPQGIRNFGLGLDQLGVTWHAALRPCYSWTTPGKEGGQHLLYRLPEALRNFQKGVPAYGVEILGAVHYMLAPCSKRLKDGGYTLINVPECWGEPPVELAPLLLRQTGAGRSTGTRTTGYGFPEMVFDDDGRIVEGHRHDFCYCAAVKAASKSRSLSGVVAAIRTAESACPPDANGVVFELGGDETRRMAVNAVQYIRSQTNEQAATFRLLTTRGAPR